MKFLSRRLLFYLLAAWVSLTINFFLPRLMPGDPASIVLARFRGQLQPEALEALRQTFGFTDESLLVQYGRYLLSIFSGDFGISTSYFPSPVADVMLQGLVWTVLLAGTSVLISFTLGSLIGIWTAWYRGGFVDRYVTPSLVFLGSFPYFWMAMILVYYFGFKWSLLPAAHAYSPNIQPAFSWAFTTDVVIHMILPGSSIVLATIGGWVLNMRNAMISTLNSEYINLAQAKGLPEKAIMLRYAARNAMLPNITSFGMALGYVLAGSLLTEIVFSYPGQGYLLLQAVKTQDFPLMQGIFFIITIAVLLANWIVDLAYLWLDPRTRGVSS